MEEQEQEQEGIEEHEISELEFFSFFFWGMKMVFWSLTGSAFLPEQLLGGNVILVL